MRKPILTIVCALACLAALSADPSQFTVAIGDEQWPLIQTWDTEGNYAGLYAEFMADLGRRMGWTARLKPVPWARAQESVASGDADAMIAVATPARLAIAHGSDDPVFSLYFTVYTWKGHPRLEEIQSLKSLDDVLRSGLTTVSNRGNGWHVEHVEALGIPTAWVNDDTTMLRFLTARRSDLIIDSPLTMAPRIRELRLGDKIVSTKVRLEETRLSLLVSKKSPFAADWKDINLAVTEVVNGPEYRKLLDTLLGY